MKTRRPPGLDRDFDRMLTRPPRLVAEANPDRDARGRLILDDPAAPPWWSPRVGGGS